jgi:hypothetical protein
MMRQPAGAMGTDPPIHAKSTLKDFPDTPSVYGVSHHGVIQGGARSFYPDLSRSGRLEAKPLHLGMPLHFTGFLLNLD